MIFHIYDWRLNSSEFERTTLHDRATLLVKINESKSFWWKPGTSHSDSAKLYFKEQNSFIELAQKDGRGYGAKIFGPYAIIGHYGTLPKVFDADRSGRFLGEKRGDKDSKYADHSVLIHPDNGQLIHFQRTRAGYSHCRVEINELWSASPSPPTCN